MSSAVSQDFVEVYLAPDYAQGEKLRELLERNGLSCMVTRGSMLQPADIRVMCLAGDRERAREIIAAYLEPAEDEPVLTCAACGKVVTEDDVECPACGEPLGAVDEDGDGGDGGPPPGA